MPRRAAFTLLELVVTLAMGLVLFYFAARAISGFIASSALNVGAQMINDSLAEARQDALTQNVPVEVRLYGTSPADYEAWQLRQSSTDGTTQALGPVITLPSGLAIDATTIHSTLVAATAAPAPDPSDPRLNALTRCFHFLPGGATDLASSTQWTLTVRAAAQTDPAKFPANWACVTLDPVSGRAQVYRP